MVAAGSRKIRSSNRTISVESTVGVGSTFEVRLPIEAVSKLTPVMIPSRVQRGGEVLVIDDGPSVPELVQRHLAAIGAQVRWARSGTEGIAMALRQRPSLITLDVLLPDLSGWEVLNEVKRHPDLCEIPVVMMSIVPEASQAAVLGAQEFLVKPVDRQRLLKAVLRFLPDDRVEGEILVVDDQPLVREVLERNLTVAGHHVRLAADGIEALESIRSHRPDLILLDLMMPRMDGFEVIARLRDDPKLSTIPVVVLTAMELSPADRRRFSAGVASVLSKTQPTSTVLDTVRWALKAQAAGEKG